MAPDTAAPPQQPDTTANGHALLIEPPDISHLPTEDETPLDSFFQGQQMRLLVEPLKASWPGPPSKKFIVAANVGIYPVPRTPAIVPDVFLTLDVVANTDYTQKENRCYFTWIVGKNPEVIVEIVSNTEGGEDTTKLAKYAQMRVSYYVIFDPLRLLGPQELRIFVLVGARYERLEGTWLPDAGLGLCRWHGSWEGQEASWLRWCDQSGNVIPTGAERAEMEQQRAVEEKKRADDEKKRADDEKKRADDEKKRADEAAGRARTLATKLREFGVDPDSLK